MSTLISRPRVRELIPASGRRARLIGAPAGYGKTVALRDFANSVNAVYMALPAQTSFARFSHDLVKALAPYAPGLQLTLMGAYTRALQTSDPPVTLATWLLQNLGNTPCTIVLDDLHHAADGGVARFVIEAVERSPETCTWIIASENLSELPIPSWLAREVTGYPFHPFQLCLTIEEALQFARHLSLNSDAATIRRLHEITHGIPAEFVFALRAPNGLIDKDDHLDRFQGFAARIFEGFSTSERETIVRTSVLPSFDDVAIRSLLGQEGPLRLAALREKAPYIFEPGELRYQTCFAAFLSSQLAVRSDREEIVAAAASALEAAGEPATSLQLLASIGREKEILAIVDRHGFASLENDDAVTLHDAVAGLGEAARMRSPVAMTVLGMSASLNNQPDVSESFFKNALQVCRNEAQRRGVRFWYGCDLIRRGRADAIEILESDEQAPGLSRFLRVATQAALAAAYAMAGDDKSAVKLITPLLESASELDDVTLAARVYHQGSYVALRGTRYADAKKLALQSLKLAERVGAYETAAGALSVLHNVAVNVDEDMNDATGYLRRIAECGAKCGSVEKQLYALCNAYEIEVERGDEDAAAALEEELRAFDVRYGTRHADEAILPAQVLQLAWRGEFTRAYQILRASGDQQKDSGRRALRWSEIALYAAAAGVRGGALTAIQKAHGQLESAHGTDGHTWRARAYLALASLLLGRLRPAQAAIQSIGTDISGAPERLRLLIEFVAQLTELHAGSLEQLVILQSLERLYERGFGGFARMLEALPGDLLTSSSHEPGKVKIA